MHQKRVTTGQIRKDLCKKCRSPAHVHSVSSFIFTEGHGQPKRSVIFFQPDDSSTALGGDQATPTRSDFSTLCQIEEFRTPPNQKSSARRRIDLQQQLLAGQRVVKKYRKYAKNAEFRRLRTIVPALTSKNDASKVKFFLELTWSPQF